MPDTTIKCATCNREFVFRAGEQSFFAAKGFREGPRHCASCRTRRKQEKRERLAPEPKTPERFEASCSGCGIAAHVPFRPAAGRPVYCGDCYACRLNHGSSYERTY